MVSSVMAGGLSPYVAKKLFGKFYKKKEHAIIEPYDKQLAIFSIALFIFYILSLMIFGKQDSFEDFIYSLLMIIILCFSCFYIPSFFHKKK